MKRMKAWLLPTLIGLLVAGVLFSALQYRNAKDRAARAEQQHREVLELAQQIQSLSQQASIAVTHTGEAQSLSGLVEAAATECGINTEQIISINAQDARRMGQSPYYRLPTRITLEHVTLPQLVELLDKLRKADLLRIEDCRLFAPHGDVVGSTWNAEFTIAYLIYEPTQDLHNG
ncbi:MAG: hypothetical protein KTR15_08070 [Phycisphaeraceae bacterium]|nr:hypothetical protein [Phycisphaeraceae bacterium]